MYEMKDEYLTGIAFIDSQHRRLFELAEEAYQLLMNQLIPDKYDHIRLILQGLKDYTKKHFADEEAYMESIQYKRLFTQKIQHEKFVQRLEDFDMETIDLNHEGSINDILELLTHWLKDHILEMDKRIALN